MCCPHPSRRIQEVEPFLRKSGGSNFGGRQASIRTRAKALIGMVRLYASGLNGMGGSKLQAQGICVESHAVNTLFCVGCCVEGGASGLSAHNLLGQGSTPTHLSVSLLMACHRRPKSQGRLPPQGFRYTVCSVCLCVCGFSHGRMIDIVVARCQAEGFGPVACPGVIQKPLD